MSAAGSPIEIKVRVAGNGDVALSLVPAESGPKPPMDIVIVMDESGSMHDSANPTGAEEIKLFTKMDLAKRGAEVVIRALGPEDTLTVLGFSNKVYRRLPSTPMTDAGKLKAIEEVKKIDENGCTALWDGLHAGLVALEEAAAAPVDANAPLRHRACIILTDGQPQPSPPEGEVAALKKYLDAKNALGGCKLITIGFGYDVNSKLLVDLANTQGDGYGNEFIFIPDGTMLLTSFVNMIANLQSTCAYRALLRLLPPGPDTDVTRSLGNFSSFGSISGNVVDALESAFTGVSITPDQTPGNGISIPSLVTVTGEATFKYLSTSAGIGLEVDFGDVLYGQERIVVLKEKSPGSAAAWKTWGLVADYRPVGFTPKPAPRAPIIATDSATVSRELYRGMAISAIHQAMRMASVDLALGQKHVKDCVLATMAAQDSGSLNPHPILEDLLGQVSEAISSTQSWNKWGGHYLRSLLCAHRSMQCNNFKDPGVLAYGSPHSRSKRDELDSMCNSLPVPTPSLIPRGAAYGMPATGQPMVTATAFRDAFNNADGGCFGTGTQVLMADEEKIRYQSIESLRKGDLVSTPEGPAKVVCLIKYSGVRTVRLPGSGLVITAWHPVQMTPEGPWKFPADILAERMTEEGRSIPQDVSSLFESMDASVFNLVLEAGHVVTVDGGVKAVTLGHGKEDEEVAHPYWGTKDVVEDLREQPGFEGGLVDLGRVGGQVTMRVERPQGTSSLISA